MILTYLAFLLRHQFVEGSFLQPALINAQFNNLTLVGTALVLGGQFSLSAINRMWFGEKCVSTLSYFFPMQNFQLLKWNIFMHCISCVYTISKAAITA
jgi:hypothetical protein